MEAAFPTSPASPELSPQRLMQFTFGFAPPLIIEVAIRLKIFDVLDEGATTLEQLCRETHASNRGLRAVLNALVGLEMLRKDEEGRYALTPESSMFLVTGKPTFHGAFFLLTREPMLTQWGKLYDIVRSGRPEHHINLPHDGVPFFLQFVENIFAIHHPAAEKLADCLQVAQVKSSLSVLDLAAGSGVWSVALAKRSRHVRVVAVDWPDIIPVTGRVAAQNGVIDQYSFAAGDILDVDFGYGHAIATLGHILHSEGDARSRQLLKKVFAALAPGGTVAIAEILVDAERKQALPALLFAVNMVVNSDHGDTFSFEEIADWLRDAGFSAVRTIDAPGLAPLLILANKPD